MDKTNIEENSGVLYVCPTPIGNLNDMPNRVIEVLSKVDLIAAEDTRNTIKLLNHFNIKNRLVSYYEHNKVQRGNYLIKLLLEGKSIAVVSDAGMPGISDPGEDIIKLAIEHEIKIEVIPGPSAFVCALVVSGLPTGRFSFEGFLPMSKKGRKERLEEVKNDTRTLIFYEAPHKLIYTLEDMYKVFGNRRISLVRELTKRFEEVKRFTFSEAIEYYNENTPKGEFVLVIEGKSAEELKIEEETKWDNISIEDHVKMYIEQGMAKNEAIKQAAKDRGIKKNDVYKIFVNN